MPRKPLTPVPDGMALTKTDCRFILESLDFTRQAFEEYHYPTPQLQAERLADVRAVILKVRALRNSLPEV